METDEVIQLLRANAARFEAEVTQFDQEKFIQQVLAATVGQDAGQHPEPSSARQGPSEGRGGAEG